MLALFNVGYCWRCDTRHHRLYPDPLFPLQRAGWLGICANCYSDRTQIKTRYAHFGRWLKPNRDIEPIA
jgi:hypothetical protein